MDITKLEPTQLWTIFNRITKIPRPSRKEEKIIEYIEQFAAEHNLQIEKDTANNILVSKPASPGMENKKTVILQSHLDMVCEKHNHLNFNFMTDPIPAYIDGNYIKTHGTTLGADDGIGIAASLAILQSDNIPHGPIQCLFTTDEETGLNGARELDPKFLAKADILINLDSEELGEFCIGCAGGKNTRGIFKYKTIETPGNHYWFEVKIDKLIGGHSGSDIHLGRGNANKIITRYLWTLNKETPIQLATINGGNLHNAIPREANAIIGIPIKDREKAIITLNTLQAVLSEEYEQTDKNVRLAIETVSQPQTCLDQEDARKILNTIYALPHGVISMSHKIEGMVETSTNLASVKMTENNTITITTSQRSSSETLKTDICNQIQACFTLAGASVEFSDGYPGWKPNTDSEILKIAGNIYEKMFGKPINVTVIHAGLECGLFLEKKNSLDVISCGPTINDAHSPEEKIDITTVGQWWKFLIELLKTIPS
ncbi:MAG: aminoacyl-histidine dipeptidase [Dysgonamonadaceae bacterium]|jgi:dipeptidase D|nr:aminoacyl-histidine dipeptidase [Dysgonamonadaceae bacterium]